MVCFALSRNKESDLRLAAPKRGVGCVPQDPRQRRRRERCAALRRNGRGGAAAVQHRARTAGCPLRSRSPGPAAPRPAPSRISVRGAPSRRSRPAGLGQRTGPGAGGDALGRLRSAAPGAAAALPGAGRRGEPGRAELRRRHRAFPPRRERLTNLRGRRPLRTAAVPGEPLRCAGARGSRVGGCAAAHVAIIFCRRSAGLSALPFAPAAAAGTSWGPTAAGGPRPRRARGEEAALRCSPPDPCGAGAPRGPGPPRDTCRHRRPEDARRPVLPRGPGGTAEAEAECGRRPGGPPPAPAPSSLAPRSRRPAPARGGVCFAPGAALGGARAAPAPAVPRAPPPGPHTPRLSLLRPLARRGAQSEGVWQTPSADCPRADPVC